MRTPATLPRDREALPISQPASDATATGERTRWLASYGPAALGVLVALAAGALYARTVAPSVMPGDYAEFQMAAAVLGVPHPTGYPLYIMLAKLFTFLPFGDVAYRVNLSSVIYMAGATGLLYAAGVRLLRLLGLRTMWWAAAIGAALFAVAPTVWSMALVARSYALNALLVGSVVFALISWRHTARPHWFYASCFLIGLSMVHHGTTYLLLPAYGLYLLNAERTKDEGRRTNAGGGSGVAQYLARSRAPRTALRIALGFLALLAGYSPILFLVYRFIWGSPYYWGNPSTWKDFFNLLTGGPFHDQILGFGWGAQLDRLAFGIGQLSGQYTVLGIAAGLVGLAVLWRYMWREAALFTLMLVGNFFFAMNYALVGYLYFIPTYLLWGIFVSVAVGWAGGLLLRYVRGATVRLAARAGLAVGGVALVAAIVYAGVFRYPGMDQSGQTATRDDALALLNSAPPNASLYMDWEELSVIRFYRMVYGMRPDLALHSGDPSDWAKEIYCDLAYGVPVFAGKFAGAQPAPVARDFDMQPSTLGWWVTGVRNPALYEIPPCGTCATCR